MGSLGYDIFWNFAHERQRVYLRKLADPSVPPGGLTDDTIIQSHRFTNPYRASDRVSQYLINSVQGHEWDWEDTFVRTLVFKVFNKIPTWERIVGTLGGEICAESLEDGSVGAAVEAVSRMGPLYSGAYLMPPPQRFSGPKHIRHLELIKHMVDTGAHGKIHGAEDMACAFEVLHSFESVGSFLAYQWVTDLNYSSHLSFLEDEFVAMGPGSKRGVRKCFPNDMRTPESIIKAVMESQSAEFSKRGLVWDGLWGRDLQLIDVQNLFCEVDKYTRAAAPELSEHIPGNSGNRIKQNYRPAADPMTARFPDRWGINSAAEAWIISNRASH